MALHLCYGCLHHFPDSALTPQESFQDELSIRLQSLRSLVAKFQPTNAQSRQCVSLMEGELRALVIAFNKELTEKQELIDKQAIQLRFYSENEEAMQKQFNQLQQAKQQKNVSRTVAKDNNSNVYSSKLLQRFLASSRMAPLTSRQTEAQEASDNRFADREQSARRALASQGSGKRAGGGGAGGKGGNHSGGGPNKPVDMVSASVYHVLEYVAATCKAAYAVLWIQSEENDELVAPFVISDDMLRAGRFGVAPMHISVASTTAGAVISTGIAANIIRNPVTNAAEETFHQAMHHTTRSTLFVPVFKKYGAEDRRSIGVVQVIAWPSAAPFTTQDETTLFTVSQLFTHLLSSYRRAFIGDWMSQTFDPNPVIKHSDYFIGMDQQRGNRSNLSVNVLDDCIQTMPPSMLIYRNDATGHTQDGKTIKVTKDDIRVGAGPMKVPKDALKEVEKQQIMLNESWKGSVNTNIELKKELEQVKRQLDEAKHGMNEARKAAAQESLHFPPLSSALPHSNQQQQHQVTPSKRRKHASAATALTTAELDELENETMGRMQVEQEYKEERAATARPKLQTPPGTAPANVGRGPHPPAAASARGGGRFDSGKNVKSSTFVTQQ